MENKIIYQCKKCDKKYKTKVSLEKHEKNVRLKTPKIILSNHPKKRIIMM